MWIIASRWERLRKNEEWIFNGMNFWKECEYNLRSRNVNLRHKKIWDVDLRVLEVTSNFFFARVWICSKDFLFFLLLSEKEGRKKIDKGGILKKVKVENVDWRYQRWFKFIFVQVPDLFKNFSISV